ncbi:hypothetical protein PR048_029920 [Dryococelus australis]|uniref:Mediator of RNA polymerase II transcription subunit 16 n=1 Tax=Dryococelus australis TaxID=614101 RepID=A0ABQ9G7H6_9NEOP|nr:hypothetical protein PR048_029920 [Dryococelus australis]
MAGMMVVSLVAEKKDSALYSDKFSQVRFLPSARHWGSQPTEGCLVVSTTGLVGVVVVCRQVQGTPQLLTTTESLANTRSRITAVDICYGKNGHFLVAVSSGNASLPIQCFRVSVSQAEDKCSVVSQALPSFFLQPRPNKDSQCKCLTSPSECPVFVQKNQGCCRSTGRHVVQLKFVVREDADSLVVAANGDAGCRVEIWELREKAVQIHIMFQSKSHPAPAEPFKMVSLSSFAVSSLWLGKLGKMPPSSCASPPLSLSRCASPLLSLSHCITIFLCLPTTLSLSQCLHLPVPPHHSPSLTVPPSSCAFGPPFLSHCASIFLCLPTTLLSHCVTIFLCLPTTLPRSLCLHLPVLPTTLPLSQCLHLPVPPHHSPFLTLSLTLTLSHCVSYTLSLSLCLHLPAPPYLSHCVTIFLCHPTTLPLSLCLPHSPSHRVSIFLCLPTTIILQH